MMQRQLSIALANGLSENDIQNCSIFQLRKYRCDLNTYKKLMSHVRSAGLIG